MEQRAADLQARLATVTGFGGLVNAMRGVAASQEQHSRTLIDGVNAYAQTVAQAMAQALALLPPTDGGTAEAPVADRALWLVFCAEQGFNGGFSDQVLAAASEARADRMMLLGSQGLRLAASRGIEAEWSGPLIAHWDAAIGASERLREALVQALARRAAPRVELVYAELQNGHRYQVVRRRLLPLDLDALRSPAENAPLIQLAPGRLFDALASEYVAAQLTRAVLHSHASENLARLQAMAAAHENVERMTGSLQAEDRRLRQEGITAEIVELAAGVRAVRAA